MVRMTLFGVMSTTLTFVNAGETTTKDNAVTEQEDQADSLPEKPSIKIKVPDNFDPSENISEGLSVSFPVDI